MSVCADAMLSSGVHVYPTEAMNLRHGLDVRGWMKAGLVNNWSGTASCGNPLDTSCAPPQAL